MDKDICRQCNGYGEVMRLNDPSSQDTSYEMVSCGNCFGTGISASGPPMPRVRKPGEKSVKQLMDEAWKKAFPDLEGRL